MIECDESYTSKTCGYCGVINDKLGSSKEFKCKANTCPQKHLSSDRDIHAARSILLRYLTRNNIKRSWVCYLVPAVTDVINLCY